MTKLADELWEKIRQYFCKHEFSLSDMKREPDTSITWPCCKCGKSFNEPYGLAMMKYGKLIGPRN